MINRTPFPPALVSEPPHGEESSGRIPTSWQAATKWFQLPSSLQGYLVFLLCLLILAFTMVLHVTLSAEILRLNVDLNSLIAEKERIERHNANLVWLIAQRSSLTDASKTASDLEYVPVTDIRYALPGNDLSTMTPSEPIVSQYQEQNASGPSGWQRAWRRLQDSYFEARQWLAARTGW